MDRLWPDNSTSRVIVDNVDSSISLTCAEFDEKIFIYFIDTDGKLVELNHSVVHGKEVNMRYIDGGEEKIEMIKAVKTQTGECLVFYKKCSGLYWFNLKNSQKEIKENKIKLSFSMNKKNNFEVLQN